MWVDIDATPDLLLLIQQKLRIVQYWNKGLLVLFSFHQGRWIDYNSKSEITETEA